MFGVISTKEKAGELKFNFKETNQKSQVKFFTMNSNFAVVVNEIDEIQLYGEFSSYHRNDLNLLYTEPAQFKLHFHDRKIKKICQNSEMLLILSEKGNLFSWGRDRGNTGLLGQKNVRYVSMPQQIQYFCDENIVLQDICLSDTIACASNQLMNQIYNWGNFIDQNIAYPQCLIQENSQKFKQVYCSNQNYYSLSNGNKLYQYNKQRQLMQLLSEIEFDAVMVDKRFDIVCGQSKEKIFIYQNYDWTEIKFSNISVDSFQIQDKQIIMIGSNKKTNFLEDDQVKDKLYIWSEQKQESYEIELKFKKLKIFQVELRDFVGIQFQSSTQFEDDLFAFNQKQNNMKNFMLKVQNTQIEVEDVKNNSQKDLNQLQTLNRIKNDIELFRQNNHSKQVDFRSQSTQIIQTKFDPQISQNLVQNHMIRSRLNNEADLIQAKQNNSLSRSRLNASFGIDNQDEMRSNLNSHRFMDNCSVQNSSRINYNNASKFGESYDDTPDNQLLKEQIKQMQNKLLSIDNEIQGIQTSRHVKRKRYRHASQQTETKNQIYSLDKFNLFIKILQRNAKYEGFKQILKVLHKQKSQKRSIQKILRIKYKIECKNLIHKLLQHKENCKMQEWSQAIFEMRKAMGMKLLYMSVKNIFYKQKKNAIVDLKKQKFKINQYNNLKILSRLIQNKKQSFKFESFKLITLYIQQQNQINNQKQKFIHFLIKPIKKLIMNQCKESLLQLVQYSNPNIDEIKGILPEVHLPIIEQNIQTQKSQNNSIDFYTKSTSKFFDQQEFSSQISPIKQSKFNYQNQNQQSDDQLDKTFSNKLNEIKLSEKSYKQIDKSSSQKRNIKLLQELDQLIVNEKNAILIMSASDQKNTFKKEKSSFINQDIQFKSSIGKTTDNGFIQKVEFLTDSLNKTSKNLQFIN